MIGLFWALRIITIHILGDFQYDVKSYRDAIFSKNYTESNEFFQQQQKIKYH